MLTGEQLKNWMRERGLSADALAVKLGVSSGTVYRLCTRASIPTPYVLALQLLGLKDVEQPPRAANS